MYFLHILRTTRTDFTIDFVYVNCDHSLVVVGRKCTFLWYDVMFARNRLGKGKPVGEGILSDSPGQYWGVQYDAYDCFVEVKFLPTEANTV